MLECKLEELKLGGIDIIRNICERLTKDQSYGGQSEPVWEPPTKEIIVCDENLEHLKNIFAVILKHKWCSKCEDNHDI